MVDCRQGNHVTDMSRLPVIPQNKGVLSVTNLQLHELNHLILNMTFQDLFTKPSSLNQHTMNDFSITKIKRKYK